MLWQMRWFFAIVIAISILASIAMSFAIFLFTKNPLSFTFPSSLILIVRPMIGFLFPQKQRNSK